MLNLFIISFIVAAIVAYTIYLTVVIIKNEIFKFSNNDENDNKPKID